MRPTDCREGEKLLQNVAKPGEGPCTLVTRRLRRVANIRQHSIQEGEVMNSGTLKMTGLAGLAWGVLVLVAYLAIFIFVGRAVAGGAGGTIIVQILALLAALAFVVMMFLLSQQIASSIGKIACYA